VNFLTPELVELGSVGILLALFFGTFVSEDLACITAGSLIAMQAVDPIAATFACFAGIVVGDVMLFGVGRVFGRRALSSRIGSRFVSEASLDRASRWISTRGLSAVFISRFVSGLRLPIYFLSGTLRLNAKRFVLLVAVAAAIWTPLIVGAAALWQMTVPFGAIAGLIIAFVLFRFAFRLTDRKRRRMLAGRLKRIRQWEFWPLWLFYAPVVVYVLLLAIKHRGFTFTAVNPGMPAGGFVGESKDSIYKMIATSDAAEQHLLRYVRIAFESDVRIAVEFAESISYPVVVKPDAGERGNGVAIVRSENELRLALAGAVGDVLVQEFVDGIEASVFYYRYPGEDNGRIFSITEKVFPYVMGDGVSTVEELILSDARAHVIAETYFRRNASRLGDIPSAGERILLVNIGTHSKGAIFRDGGWMRSKELEAAIDRLSRDIRGFYFGRYDLRAESFAELAAGNFKIIELNGVTSESTNIYDPQYSLIDAYRILFAQWRIAFEIGRKNASAGAERTSVSDLISLIVRSKRPV
jgi:membrane protein DedA with SNARE-associated domain